LPVGVVTDTTELVGKRVSEDIEQGAFFRPSQLGETLTGPLSAQLDQDKVVVAFPVDDLLYRSKVVHEGDHVDLLLTYEVIEETPIDIRQGKSTSFTLQNIEVMRVIRDQPSEENPNPEASAILFAMSPQDAVVVKFVKDSGGTMDFILRSKLNAEPFITESINQDYLFEKYGFKAPRTSAQVKSE
jgi:pilus assembly protein CpaB